MLYITPIANVLPSSPQNLAFDPLEDVSFFPSPPSSQEPSPFPSTEPTPPQRPEKSTVEIAIAKALAVLHGVSQRSADDESDSDEDLSQAPEPFAHTDSLTQQDLNTLLSYGLSLSQIEIYRFQFDDSLGIVAWVNQHLFDEYSSDAVEVRDRWKVYWGKPPALEGHDRLWWFDMHEALDDWQARWTTFRAVVEEPEKGRLIVSCPVGAEERIPEVAAEEQDEFVKNEYAESESEEEQCVIDDDMHDETTDESEVESSGAPSTGEATAGSSDSDESME